VGPRVSAYHRAREANLFTSYFHRSILLFM
jgi:hypothetical protein